MRKHYAQLAQLVEQGTENPCVSGSIPELGISTERSRNASKDAKHLNSVWDISSVGRALDF